MSLKDIVKQNLVNLRKESGLTQIELAKKVNFSDKAVSRWENGEVSPDIETFEALSKIYSVPTSYFFEEHTQKDEVAVQPTQLRNKLVYCIMSVMAVWTFAAILFVYLNTLQNITAWQIFVWAVPATCAVLLVCNHQWLKIERLNLITRSVLIWSLLTGVYLQFLSYNLWLIYIIGAPLQVTIIARYFLR